MLLPTSHGLPTVLDRLDDVETICPGCHHGGGPDADQPADLLPLGHGPGGCDRLDGERFLALEDYLRAHGRPWLRRPLDPVEEEALRALGWQPEEDGIVLVLLDGPRRRRLFNLDESQPAGAVLW